MGKIETFEDLIAWQKAKCLVLSVYEITNSGAFAKDFGLKDQCRRASVSVVSNIAEGFERKGNKADYYVIARHDFSSGRSNLRLNK